MTTSPGHTVSNGCGSPAVKAVKYCATGSACDAVRDLRRASSAAATKSGNHGIPEPMCSACARRTTTSPCQAVFGHLEGCDQLGYVSWAGVLDGVDLDVCCPGMWSAR